MNSIGLEDVKNPSISVQCTKVLARGQSIGLAAFCRYHFVAIISKFACKLNETEFLHGPT